MQRLQAKVAGKSPQTIAFPLEKGLINSQFFRLRARPKLATLVTLIPVTLRGESPSRGSEAGRRATVWVLQRVAGWVTPQRALTGVFIGPKMAQTVS